ncbi:class III lanthipeptide [Alkalihalobacillus sp. NPDC078783]
MKNVLELQKLSYNDNVFMQPGVEATPTTITRTVTGWSTASNGC